MNGEYLKAMDDDKFYELALPYMKEVIKKSGFYFTGRFADWEYYNMDVAMAAAMNTCARM